MAPQLELAAFKKPVPPCHGGSFSSEWLLCPSLAFRHVQTQQHAAGSKSGSSAGLTSSAAELSLFFAFSACLEMSFEADSTCDVGDKAIMDPSCALSPQHAGLISSMHANLQVHNLRLA